MYSLGLDIENSLTRLIPLQDMVGQSDTISIQLSRDLMSLFVKIPNIRPRCYAVIFEVPDSFGESLNLADLIFWNRR